jgi:hypothetical protein
MSAIFLVYCRRVADGDEPLVAVVRDEAQAQEIEARLAPTPDTRVSWEELAVRAAHAGELGPIADRELAEGELVHVVSLGGLDNDGTPTGLDPIGLAAFRRLADAVAFAEAQTDPHVRVRSLPVGWVDPGAGA